MNKKIIALVIALIVIALGIGGFMLLNHKEEASNNNTSNNNQSVNENEEQEDNNAPISDNKVLVLYFSATGTTERIAKYISEITNSNIIEIVPQEEYTDSDLDYNNNSSRANKEQNDSSSRPKIKNDINITDYDTIYLGYPIWWGDVPKIILTFIENNNLEGKKIIPFCTSGSSGINTSLNTLKSYKELNIAQGRRFSSSSTKNDVESWLKEID